MNILRLSILCFFFASCNTESDKVEFPFDETEYKKPKTKKATPAIRQIPDNLPSAKYTTEKGQLVTRDQSIPLKEPIWKKAGKPQIIENRLKKRKILLNLQKRIAGTPKKVKAIGKTVPARGKVVKAGHPISKSYLPPAVTDLDNFGFQYINQDQNLPGTIGHAVIEDSKGRIWIGTDNGLAMLEGGEMKIYTTLEGLSYNWVLSLLESSTGAIWIGTEGGGVNVFESGTFTHYGTEEGLSNNRVYSLLESSTGAIWIGTEGGGVDVFESGSFTHYGSEEGLSINSVRSLLESSTGAIWIGTNGGGVDVFESGSFTHYGSEEGLSNNRVYSLLESSTGAIWLGTDGGGVDVFDSGSFTHYGTEEGLSNNRVWSLLESSTGAIWIGTNGGGVDVLESGSFTHYGTEEGLTDNGVFSLLESSSGAIWLGTYGGGVGVLETGSFTHYGTEEGLNNNRVFSLLESSTGAIWIGTDGGGVDVFESGSFTHYGTEEGLNNNRVWSLLESATGAIWIGTYVGGVDVFESGSFTHYSTEEGLSNNSVFSLLESSTGAIWLGTDGGGVDVFDSGSFTHYGTEEGLSNNRVWSLLESSTGAIWIGTNGGGVDVFESGSFTHYGTEEGLNNNRVWSLLESSTGAIWLGTNGGVDVFESGSFTHYGTEEGLADNSVLQLAKDSLGNIWAGTGTGLTRFMAKEEGYGLTTWNKTHGLKKMDFNGPGSPMLFSTTDKVSKKGAMWAGVGGTLTAFEPPEPDTLGPQMLLTGIDINQKQIQWQKLSELKEGMQSMEGINSDTLFFSDPDSVILLSNFPPDTSSLTSAGINWSGTEDLAPYYLPKNLELPYDQNHLTFHYSGTKLSEQFDVVYRYMLLGMDKEWSPFTKEGKVDYRNIPPGVYTFKVRARGRNFLWSDEASVSFLVHPPWWLAWWAKALWFGLILGFFLTIYKVRTAALKKQRKKLRKQVADRTEELKVQNSELVLLNDEKDGILGVVAHDLRSPFNQIKGLMHLAELTSELDSEQKMYFQKIKISIGQGNQLINDLLDVGNFKHNSSTAKLNLEEVDVANLIDELYENSRKIAELKKQQLTFKSDASSPLKTDKFLLWRVLENLISNAIKYSPEGKPIVVTAQQSNGQTEFSIKDEGLGFSEEDKKKMFGKFQKLSAQPTGGESSTGLGLSIVKMIVEKLGGKIELESEQNKGSEFLVSIPNLNL